MEEKTFFEYDGVKVTNARFVVDHQTFAMSNITSVSTAQEHPSRVWPILFILAGLVTCATALPVGLILIGGGAIWLWVQKSKYHVMLKTAGGEAKALTSHQKEYIGKVVSALNNAIVHRG